MCEPSHSAKQLHQIVLEKIEPIPDLEGQVTDAHSGGVIGAWLGGNDGSSWTISIGTDGSTHWPDIARMRGE